MGPKDPASPAVKVDDEIIAVDKGAGNGVASEDEMLKAVIRHGAEPIPD